MAQDVRWRDTIARAMKSGGPEFTHFLDPASTQAFLLEATGAGLCAQGDGGDEGAERKLCAIWREGQGPQGLWPYDQLDIRWSHLSPVPTHRDLLGAVLALGVQRERIGDIRVGETRAYMVVDKQLAPYIVQSLTQAGKTHLRLALGAEPIPAQEGKMRTVQVSSMRLDALLAAALDLSRAQAQELVRSRALSVNWHEEMRIDREIHQGDVLSIRGKGRVKVQQLGGLSRKGKQHVVLELLLHG